MFDIDRWREIFQSISKNKLRSILSGFTVAFAILLFTLLFGIGNGLQNTFKKEFAGDAINAIYIWSSFTTVAYKGNQIGKKIQFKNDDFKFLKENFSKEIQTISPRIQRIVEVVHKSKKDTYTLRGIYPEYQIQESAEVEEGRFLNLRDIYQKSKVVVIGRLVEDDLFGQLSAVGKQLKIGGIMYQVIGVFSDPGGDNDERFIYTPFTTMQRLYGNTDHLDEFGITYNPNLSIDEAIVFGNKMLRTLKEKHDVSQEDQRAIGLFNNASGNREVTNMMIGLGILIFIIGFGTLIAGVVGISNIMVYVVNERTKELGIRKAVGATPKDIVAMILQEAIFITTISGYFGLILGVGILKVVGPSLKEYFILNPSVSTPVVIGATVTLIIAGVIAGYLPAKRAARIKPVVALSAD
ncbi:MAG: ABC transporter permease [Flavobacteriia bacterium]|nr:ABC transporter permease [Flavobacteriia bacterium]OIP48447.1 MAG: ABC transporter ATP-binding protein [Flavobacteriaceae bacterium CG2_30_31_66]PIV97487.1 MAG: ABC transporter ATP-binding protein [Flavobacteriaceae bacterium CG17_big_fil_post_rev_8_21_14_2_50_31_13]PIX13062.1 MAG: ABC transporter ATP-binding protein [Flavobacteriaceae bacterium CG_4_8_14_3_um_filter_31_8]PIY14311.1 MAG: ABC transporter ATP-binding protein [Flavobacteriaceae bacterium CG_4_10_14_3_um_filter_31_253]PIZ10163.